MRIPRTEEMHVFVDEIAKRMGVSGKARPGKGYTSAIEDWLVSFNDNGYIKRVPSAKLYELKEWDSGFLQSFDERFPSLARAVA